MRELLQRTRLNSIYGAQFLQAGKSTSNNDLPGERNSLASFLRFGHVYVKIRCISLIFRSIIIDKFQLFYLSISKFFQRIKPTTVITSWNFSHFHALRWLSFSTIIMFNYINIQRGACHLCYSMDLCLGKYLFGLA